MISHYCESYLSLHCKISGASSTEGEYDYFSSLRGKPMGRSGNNAGGWQYYGVAVSFVEFERLRTGM